MYSKTSYRYLKFLIPMIFLFLLFIISTAGSDKKEIGFNQLSAPSDLSTLSILSPTPDTIRYDCDTALYYDPFPNTWTGVRFTPLYNFELQAIYFGIMNAYNNTTDGCSLYVVADNGMGRPDWPSGKLDSFWVAPPVPDRIWIQVDLSSPISFSVCEDFHIIYGPAPGGPYPGPGWWNLFDSDGTTTQRSYVSHDNRQTWLTITNSDAFIRAGGEYFTVKINEILVRAGDTGELLKDYLFQWVELFNLGVDTVNMGGWTISDREGLALATLPSWDFPPGTHLTVHFDTGINDNDFLDGEGHYYVGDSTFVFDMDNDECALFNGQPGSGTIRDFVAWAISSYTPGTAHDYAVSAGIWSSGSYFAAESVLESDPIGRAVDGYDTNSPDDFLRRSWEDLLQFGNQQPSNPLQLSPVDNDVIDESQPTFSWRTVLNASGYDLQIDDDPDFSSPIVDTAGYASTSYAPGSSLPTGAIFWRVRPAGTLHWSRTWLFVITGGALGGDSPNSTQSCPHLYQRKDSELLCIWNARNGTRPGCPETGTDPWDGPHPNSRPIQQHGRMYCVPTSMTMMNHKFGGDMLIDRVSYYLNHEYADNPAGPEGDLGHNRGYAPPPNAIESSGLSWALNGAPITVKSGPFPFDSLKKWIDERDCFMARIPGHLIVIDDYLEINWPDDTVQIVYFQDPARGPYTRKVYKYISGVAPPVGIALDFAHVFLHPTDWNQARDMEPSCTTDSDGDEVMDFDEENRFCSVKNDTDTDDDEVPDKQEIRSYTFHDTDHAGHENDPLNFPDVDGDGLRAECDCDTDNDSDFDGGEDIDGDGKSPEAGETCVYQDPGEMAIWTDKAIYCPWEHVLLDGQTFHGNSSYPYDIIQGCPDLDDSAGLGWAGFVTTDGGGVIHTKDLGTFPVGIYEVIADVLWDMHYSEPDNWDPWTCFRVIPCDTGCCEFYDHCEMIIENDCIAAGGTWYPSPPYECIGYSCQACAEDPNDLGERDTLHVETFDCDHIYEADSGSFDSVRVAIYVTHDSNTFYWEEEMKWVQDSIAAFVVPLKFWHEPEGCADSVIFPTFDFWNNDYINPDVPWMNRSMFRHIVDSHTGDTVYNRLLQMVEDGKDAWSVYTDIESHSSDGDSGHVFLVLIRDVNSQEWWEGSRELLATMTFHVYMSEACDTTEIGIDSTFWPPADHLTFTRHDAVVYSPCHFLPVKDTVYIVPGLLCGDCNGDGAIDIGDVVYLINYLFIEGSPPDPLCRGDVNCDGAVDVGDVAYLINYLFLGTSPPCSECCDL